jgi:hypothetical protein
MPAIAHVLLALASIGPIARCSESPCGVSAAAVSQKEVTASSAAQAAERPDVMSSEEGTTISFRRALESKAALRSLDLSLVIFQALDTGTTVVALRNGAAEGNPLMRAVARDPIALSAVKAAQTAGIIYLAHRVRSHDRLTAFVLMAAVNSFEAIVVSSNVRVMN